MDNHNQLGILPAERWENIILRYFYLGVTGQHELEIYTLAVNVRHKQAATNVIESGLYCREEERFSFLLFCYFWVDFFKK